MPHRWLALQALADRDSAVCASGQDAGPGAGGAALLMHFAALPFPENSLDLVLLPHTLELSEDPHTTLREVERVLVPEGKLVISGLNPASLWGFRQQRGHWCRRLGFGELFLPDEGAFIGYWRLRDWLRLLGFEVESARFGCYRPALNHPRWMQRFTWMDKAGARWWPIFGAAYFLVAVKRVRGMRMLEPAWKARTQRASAPAVAAQRHSAPAPGQRAGDPGV
jgi:SAM-dependent methyltransferase